ncbi:bifunctional serine/threonine-protein kinase/formylglycine-generating enzyme family protein [Polaribacter glomeratus]|uniref:Protein kinase domain-containing protein n=1 Tax=Polaribacter glomeratus TaxID=102 RepID=A0A2S7WW87_9FLAO|nr:bifunctional serine/threonine-protein kinase/formylglycine-generating enzyme family protein [Polaribacter glomeratus]PQJ81855.1 hypothetical protein BTO16_04390 [Polaribacter glomeratus]TXD66221.1 SUMF1/EgtB/PvdOfamily nonheme iron enzyme [Polaribacter glomeratus]
MKEEEFFKRYTYNVQKNNIGGGSFGTVYKAYDTILDREVAIKVSEVKIVGDKEFSLLEEFKAIEHLPVSMYIANYEGVFRFIERNGTYDYAIMQYYSLGNLSHYLKNNEVSLEKRESITKGILEGIGFLHQYKVVHRDLKPSNILVVDRNGEIIPKITDFGLSKQAEADGKASRFTNSFAGGTLQYSSPEQLKGLPLKLNTDLWSFGVIAYEILTGKTLFDAESQTTASAEWQNTITQKILHADVNDEIKSLSANWQKVVHHCLERDVNKRAQDTSILFRFLNGEAVSKQKTITPNNDATVIKNDNQEKKAVKRPIQKTASANNDATFIKGAKQPEKIPFKKPLVEKQTSTKFKNKNLLIYSIPVVLIIAIALFFLKPWEQEIEPLDLQTYKSYKTAAANFYQLDSLVSSLNNYKKAEVFMTGLDISKATKRLQLDGVKDSIASITARLESIAVAKETKDWESAKNTNTIEVYTTYLVEYPAGTFKTEANSTIASIKEALNSAEAKKKQEEQQKAIEHTNRAAKAIKSLEENMVYVQGGTFTMGCTSEQTGCSSNESPAHAVTLSSFNIGKYEVTQGQWQAVMGNNPSSFSGCDQCPVEQVSWNDIQSFLKKLNTATGKRFRLPTEAEWEFAARGGNKSRGYTYSGSNTLSSVGWHSGNSGDKTHAVGQKQRNELGLYDMSGNVWEWCSDWYDENYYSSSSSNNPKGPSSSSYRVIRGGSWRNSASGCRVAYRYGNEPDNRYDSDGFRVVSF